MSSSSPPPPATTIAAEYPTRRFESAHSVFPFSKADLTPADSAPASAFYTSPRFVTHIDASAIAALQQYYARHLLPASRLQPDERQRPFRMLDLCSSHVSHLPDSLQARVRAGRLWMAAIGMNAAELQRNEDARGGWRVQDLDASPDVAASSLLRSQAFDRGQVKDDSTDGQKEEPLAEDDKLDAATCVVSIDYLHRPVSVLAHLRRATKLNGTVHLAVSNRCFPTKAVSRWLRADEQQRLDMVGEYLWFAGWRQIDVVTLNDGLSHDDTASSNGSNRLAQLMRGLGVPGMGSDPLWIVRGVNTGESFERSRWPDWA